MACGPNDCIVKECIPYDSKMNTLILAHENDIIRFVLSGIIDDDKFTIYEKTDCYFCGNKGKIILT